MCIFILLLFGIVSIANAQVDSLWSRTYGGTQDERCNALCATPDGGFLLAGGNDLGGPANYHAWAVRTDSDGDTLWSRVYGGYSWDGFRAVKPTSDGGFILVGDQFDHEVDEGSWILKLSADGDSLWSTFFAYGDMQWALDMVETSDGGFLVISQLFGSGESPVPAQLARISANGDILSYRFYGNQWIGYRARSITPASGGGYVVAGTTFHNNVDFWLMKTDDNGDSVWSRSYGSQDGEIGSSVCGTSDGGYLITGFRRFEINDDRIWVVKTDADGDSLWSRTLGSCDWMPEVSIAPASDGSFLLTATSDSVPGQSRDFLLVKMSADGDSLWSRTFGRENNDYCTSIVATPDGGYILGGYTYSFGMGAADFWLLKTTPELSAEDGSILPPSSFILSNYPNPFNASTTISFNLQHESRILLNVFDLTGRSVATLANGMIYAGLHQVHFNAGALPSGIYIYRLTSGNISQSRKLVLLK